MDLKRVPHGFTKSQEAIKAAIDCLVEGGSLKRKVEEMGYVAKGTTLARINTNAKKILASNLEENLNYHMGLLSRKMNFLWTKSVEKGDYKTALSVWRTWIEALGIIGSKKDSEPTEKVKVIEIGPNIIKDGC